MQLASRVTTARASTARPRAVAAAALPDRRAVLFTALLPAVIAARPALALIPVRLGVQRDTTTQPAQRAPARAACPIKQRHNSCDVCNTMHAAGQPVCVFRRRAE